MDKTNDATLIFLFKGSGADRKICLAMKKRGFGSGKYNGVGGKVRLNEEIVAAAIREMKEEIMTETTKESLKKVAEICFYHNDPSQNQKVHAYFCDNWTGEPSETEEMKPEWFLFDKIPFDIMWPDDSCWLPEVLDGNLVRGFFRFTPDYKISGSELELVESF